MLPIFAPHGGDVPCNDSGDGNCLVEECWGEGVVGTFAAESQVECSSSLSSRNRFDHALVTALLVEDAA